MAFDYQSFASLSVNLNRQKYGPLDISTVFTSEADLKYYLSKGNFTEGVSDYWSNIVPYPYEGQIIATVYDGVKVFALVEKEDGEFETTSVGDTTAVEETIKELRDEIDSKFATTLQQVQNDTASQISAVVGQYLTGEGATETIDTLQDIVDWLNTEGSGADKIIDDIETIKTDYLKSGDKKALQDEIDVISENLANRLNIKSVDGTSLVLDDAGKLVVGSITQSQVAGLPEALEGKVDTQTSEYKGRQTAWTLLSPENQEKLASLVIGENGIEVSGKVNADNVEGLSSWVQSNRNSVEGLVSDELITTINSSVKGISIDGIVLSKDDDGIISFPVASNSLGLVKSSDAQNNVSINEDGTMTVNEININKITQTKDEELILFGGSATTSFNNN